MKHINTGVNIDIDTNKKKSVFDGLKMAQHIIYCFKSALNFARPMLT